LQQNTLIYGKAQAEIHQPLQSANLRASEVHEALLFSLVLLGDEETEYLLQQVWFDMEGTYTAS